MMCRIIGIREALPIPAGPAHKIYCEAATGCRTSSHLAGCACCDMVFLPTHGMVHTPSSPHSWSPPLEENGATIGSSLLVLPGPHFRNRSELAQGKSRLSQYALQPELHNVLAVQSPKAANCLMHVHDVAPLAQPDQAPLDRYFVSLLNRVDVILPYHDVLYIHYRIVGGLQWAAHK